jgi:transcriptional regulator with XRE-family HTH domain
MDASTFESIRLRVSRELIGLSQNQLATMVGLSPAAISQLRAGRLAPARRPSMHLAPHLAYQWDSSLALSLRHTKAFSGRCDAPP